MPNPRQVPISGLTLKLVATELLASARPWIISIAGLGLLCGAAALWLDAPGLLTATGWLLLHFGAGLLGSFLIHEAGHAVAAKWQSEGLEEMTIVRGFASFSLIPSGSSSGRAVAVTALAGPAASAVAGSILWAAAPGLHLHWWYWGHLLLLLPIFGDGQALLKGLLTGGRVIHLQGYAVPRPRISQTHH